MLKAKTSKLLFIIYGLLACSNASSLLTQNAPAIFPDSEWTVLLYADPTTDILGAVLKNIHDLLPISTNNKLQVFVQLRAYLDESNGSDNRYTCWRYKLEQNSLILVDQIKLTGDYTQDLTNATNWAFSQTNAKYHALILSGHGFGPLEPTWNERQQEWELEYDEAMLTGCPMRSNNIKLKNLKTLRGLLVNNLELKYLDNQSLISATKNISQNLHKPIDLLILDMCMGAALEHAYELTPFINYLIGCQNCELVDGIDCRRLVQHLTENKLTPLELVQRIVQDYQDYYIKISPQDIYTLSAVDCHKTIALTNSLNLLISKLNLILQHNNYLKEALRNLRRDTVSFCLVPMYTDLYSILDKLTILLTKHNFLELAQLTQQTKQLVLDSIVANVTGPQMTEAHGLSIYFPYAHIDSSYYKLPFAQKSNWLEFLELLTDAKFVSNLEDENLSDLGL